MSYHKPSILSRQTRTAFTLIELLVVISIVALLIAILLPALKSARGAANNMACLVRERQMGVGIMTYAQDHKDLIPAGYINSNVTWVDLLAPYYGVNEGNYDSFSSTRRNRMSRLMMDADIQVKNGSNFYYSAHPRLLPDIRNTDYSDPARPKLTQQRIASVKNPSKLIAIMDGTQISGGSANWVANNLDRGAINGSVMADGSYYSSYLIRDFCPTIDNTSIDAHINADAGSWGDGYQTMNIRFRHLNNTNSNVIMLDGHAQSMRYRSQYDTDVLRINVNIDY